jgi:hypothetical protein
LGSDRAEAAAAAAHETVGEMYYRREETLDARETEPATSSKEHHAEIGAPPRSDAQVEAKPKSAEEDPQQPQRRGWWQRTFRS